MGVGVRVKRGKKQATLEGRIEEIQLFKVSLTVCANHMASGETSRDQKYPQIPVNASEFLWGMW